MKWPAPDRVRSVAVVRLSSLGDVVLCEPVVRALSARYPAAEVTFVTRAAYHAVFDAHPNVRAVATLEVARAEDYDLVVDLHGRWETRRWARGARRRVTWEKRDLIDLLGAVLRQPIRARAGQADGQSARMVSDLELPMPEGGLGARLMPPNTSVPAAYGILLPGAKWSTKRWPLARWIEAGALLTEQGRASIAMGGPGDEAALEALQAAGVPTLPAHLTLREVTPLLAGARWVVGHDSGLTHLSAALGRPTVVVFGPTRASRWAPIGPHVRVVSRGLACSPCSDFGQRSCPLERRICLDDLPVRQVVDALLALTSMSGRSEEIAERME